MVVQRGEVWWASLPEPAGSGPSSQQPVVIVQTDAFNQSRIQTVICVVLTSNLRLAAAPGNVLLSQKASGLPKESVANISQLITVDKTLLTEQIGLLPTKKLRQIEEGLQLVLGLK